MKKARLSDPIIYIFYDSKQNFFIDVYGRPIYNIFELLTPQDILLYKNDPGYSLFHARQRPDILVEINEIYD